MFHITTSEAVSFLVHYMLIAFLITTGLITLQGVVARQCYTTRKGKQKHELCALTVDYRNGTCELISFKLWGGKKINQSMGDCEMKTTRIVTEEGDEEEAQRIKCYCDSGTHCAQNLTTFENFLEEKRGKDEPDYYQCLYDHFKKGVFLVPKEDHTASSTPSTTPKKAEASSTEEKHAGLKKPYLSEEAKEYLDSAITRNIFIMIFLAVVIAVATYLTLTED
ncbi:hypothetical protein V3C99_015953, partial [Haemonchus contortus]